MTDTIIRAKRSISNGVRIAIIDYGMGNIASVRKACLRFGAGVTIASKPSNLEIADKIILPGVGAFGDAMRELNKAGMSQAIKNKIKDGVPFLGICLGMHLLFERSEESKGAKGLGILAGKVLRFKANDIKIPHIGWNNIRIRDTASPTSVWRGLRPARLRSGGDTVFKGVEDNAYVYFCHSYYALPKDKNIIAARTDYGIKFASVVAKDNIFGIQFHPEKSQKVGLKILENFLKL